VEFSRHFNKFNVCCLDIANSKQHTISLFEFKAKKLLESIGNDFMALLQMLTFTKIGKLEIDFNLI
jgi:hypothetical protein